MNTYSFNFMYDRSTTNGFVAADASAATTLCRAIGYLWLASKHSDSFTIPLMAGTKVIEPLLSVNTLKFMTPKRLPSTIEPPRYMKLYNAAATAGGMLLAQDDQQTDVISNLDRPIVQKGSLIVAVTLGGVDISNELDAQLTIPVGMDATGEQFLVIGKANANAQDGVYQTPFSTALAFAILDTRRSTNVPVMVNTSVAANPSRR